MKEDMVVEGADLEVNTAKEWVITKRVATPCMVFQIRHLACLNWKRGIQLF